MRETNGVTPETAALIRLLPTLNLCWPEDMQERWWSWFREIYERLRQETAGASESVATT